MRFVVILSNILVLVADCSRQTRCLRGCDICRAHGKKSFRVCDTRR